MLQVRRHRSRPQPASSTSQGGSGPRLHRIGLGQAVALYVGAVLGAGVLVLPGQAASLAGPASVLAWLILAILGLPLSMTFAALAVTYPDTGGIATFATKAFGPTVGGVAGYFYYVAVAVGQVIVPLTGGYYVAAAFGLGGWSVFVVSDLILVAATVANLVGLRLSGRVQLGLAAGVAVLLLAATLASLSNIDAQAFVPFAPHGIAGVGQAAVLLFFAFAGWEAIAHLAGEFRDVSRDLGRATVVTVGIVGLLYLGVAFAVVTTGSYGTEALDRVAVGRVLGVGIGVSANAAAAVLATVISLGTTNAFMASVSRLGYALARDGWMPAALCRQNRHGVPSTSILVMGAIGMTGLGVAYIVGWGTEDLVGAPASLVLVTYLIGTAAGVRLLTGRARVCAVVAFVFTAAIAPFAATYMVVPIIVVVAAGGYRWVARRHHRYLAPTAGP